MESKWNTKRKRDKSLWTIWSITPTAFSRRRICFVSQGSGQSGKVQQRDPQQCEKWFCMPFIHCLTNRNIISSLHSLSGSIRKMGRCVHGNQPALPVSRPMSGRTVRFRGDASAGELVQNSIDKVTGIPIHSLYGSHSSQLVPETTINKFDIIISDIQDVGLRFYTYYITLIHLMNLCIDYNKQMIIFDRPNPNGFYVDGPILNMKYKSGIGYLPIPIVHGLTLGELANMCNGEGWLKDKKNVI